ncbi:sarcosine oxidase, alpha subunit family protein, partial [mine drainage metagenome]
HRIGGDSGALWARRAEAELRSLPEVRLLTRTTVFGVYDGSTFAALERVSDHMRVPPPHQPRQRLWTIVARRAVLAAGALERPIIFGGNDRPGVMLASAARTYVNRFRVAPGRRVAVFTACDDGWKTAFDLIEARIDVPVIIDARREAPPELRAQASRHGVSIMAGAH